jgi:serine/threonine-protein kinase haspin
MRTYVFEDQVHTTAASDHIVPYGEDAIASWKDFRPYTNVLWLWYLLEWMIIQLKKSAKTKKAKEEIKVFENEANELRNRLNPDKTRVRDFIDAADVANFAMEKGWIEMEDVYQDEEGNSTLNL